MNKNVLDAMSVGEKEGDIYLALLRNGKHTLSGIAKATKTNTTTLYPHIERLYERGFIKKTVLGKRTYYLAENPQRALSELRSKERILKREMPKLVSMFKESVHEPTISVYYGKEGLATIYDEIATTANYTRTMYSPQSHHTVFTFAEGNKFAKTLTDRGVELQNLIKNDELSKRVLKDSKKEGIKSRTKLLPRDYDLQVNMIVFNNKVALLSFESLFGMIIDDARVAKFHQDIFDFYWQNL